MARGIPRSDDDRRRVLDLCRRYPAASNITIAKATGIPATTIGDYRRAAGVERGNNRDRYSDDQRRRVVAAALIDGMPAAKAGRLVGAPPTTAKNWIYQARRFGVDRPELYDGAPYSADDDEGHIEHATMRGYLAHLFLEEQPCDLCTAAHVRDTVAVEQSDRNVKKRLRGLQSVHAGFARAYLPTHPN